MFLCAHACLCLYAQSDSDGSDRVPLNMLYNAFGTLDQLKKGIGTDEEVCYVLILVGFVFLHICI